MATTTMSPAGQALGWAVTAASAQPLSRYELYDPMLETTTRCATAAEMLAKVEAIAKSEGAEPRSFVYRGLDASIQHVRKVDGQWVREDGLTLQEVQDGIDVEALRSIEARGERREALSEPFTHDDRLAMVDAFAFRSIQNPALRESAAVQIADNARSYPAYKQSLDGFARVQMPRGPMAQEIYDLDAAHDRKIAAKEDRKGANIEAVRLELRAKAAAWSPEEAATQATLDAARFRQEFDGLERYFKVLDMALLADASPDYKAALQAAAPEVFMEEGMDVQENVKIKQLARDLSRVALGEMYSDKVLESAIEHFQVLSERPGRLASNPAVTPQRITQALTHCKLARHGVRDSHHHLQDASVLLALMSEAPSLEAAQADPAPEAGRGAVDTRFLLNAMLNYIDFPERIDSNWLRASIERHAAGQSLCQPLPELQMMLPESKTQEQAKALVARVAGELQGSVGLWVPSEAKQWVKSMVTLEDGRSVRVAASTGGVVQVNGYPFTPEAPRTLNVTHDAVTESLRSAFDAEPMPLLPIKREVVTFNGGELAGAWASMSEAENRLAGYLTALPDGTAVVHGADAWYLQEVEQQLVLMHANVQDGRLVDAQSRFEASLEAVDVGAEELADYTRLVDAVAGDFIRDPKSWQTMPVELDEAPSLGM